jgi:hypothetical protein
MTKAEKVNEKQYRGKSIEDWRNNASEDYVGTPISVLKYIAVLEDLTTENTRLREALDVCSKSLATYGSHPIIEMQVKKALTPSK